MEGCNLQNKSFRFVLFFFWGGSFEKYSNYREASIRRHGMSNRAGSFVTTILETARLAYTHKYLEPVINFIWDPSNYIRVVNSERFFALFLF